jgi:DMSO/TMAO reductase YedYZ molybdopterin-dependent catalytic subunit
MERDTSTRVGTAAGAIGALAMVSVFFVARLSLGVPTPSEMFADFSAPFIPVHLFGLIIGLFHGYTPLKMFGFSSVILGQVVVGIVAGYAYVRTGRSTRFLIGFPLAAWLIVAGIFEGQLRGNYRDYAPPTSTLLTLATLGIGFALFSFVLAYLAGRSEDAKRVGRESTAPTRAIWIAGSVATIGAALGWGRLFAKATFSYDGHVDLGPDVAAITPIERFYSVTKNVTDPSVRANDWSLSIEGAVDRPIRFDLEQFRALPSVEQETTLMCINNDPDGGLMSNALWRGVPMPSLIAATKPHAGIVRAILRSGDNYADTIPFEKAMDPTTLVAYMMNGAPLRAKHGFPARAIVPGWFGEKNVKWIRAIELVTEPIEGFYEKQGWGPDFHTPTHSRFDAPDFTKPLRGKASIELRGVAFCGDRGVARVEVSDDDGRTWKTAEFTSHYQRLAWRLWRYEWRPVRRGAYRLAVRATDSAGRVQTSMDRSAETQGATGLHRVTAHVA